MTDFPIAIDEYPYAAHVRSLAGRAHSLLRMQSDGGGPAVHDLDVLLRQAEELRTRLSVHHRGDLLRWLDGLRERVEALECQPAPMPACQESDSPGPHRFRDSD